MKEKQVRVFLYCDNKTLKVLERTARIRGFLCESSDYVNGYIRLLIAQDLLKNEE